MHIYLLTNIVNGKKYIGQSKMQPKRRLLRHLWAAENPKTRNSQLITRAIHKYGKDAFEHEVVQWCDSQEQLDAAEVEWIEKMKSMHPNGYNLREGGHSGFHTPEVRERMSQVKSGKPLSKEHVENMAKALRGRKLPLETRIKMSESHKRIGSGSMRSLTFEKRSELQKKRFSDESQRQKMSDSVKNGNLTFAKLNMEIVISARQEFEAKETTCGELAKRYGVSYVTMYDALRGKTWK